MQKCENLNSAVNVGETISPENCDIQFNNRNA